MSILDTSLSTAGQRLKKIRLMAGIRTRKEFYLKSKISPNTLQGWEQDKNKLSQKGANRIVAALWKENIMCSTQWLLCGHGMPPRIMESNYFNGQARENSQELELSSVMDQESKISEEKSLFNKINPNSVIFRIDDDAMQPVYEVNTLVGGIYHAPEKLNQFFGWACIVEFEHERVKVISVRTLTKGTHENTVNLCGLNSTAKQSIINYYNVSLLSFAPIIWTRKALIS